MYEIGYLHSTVALEAVPSLRLTDKLYGRGGLQTFLSRKLNLCENHSLMRLSLGYVSCGLQKLNLFTAVPLSYFQTYNLPLPRRTVRINPSKQLLPQSHLIERFLLLRPVSIELVLVAFQAALGRD